jgi:hypothetical protein
MCIHCSLQTRSFLALIATTMSIVTLLVLGAVSASAHRAPARISRTAHSSCKHRGHSKSHCKAGTLLLGGPQRTGPQGPAGPQGPQGPKGESGATGPQGPGAVEYTYNSTAPALTEQNTPLGAAGPFQLTGSCVQLGPKLVVVTLGASNSARVEFDEVRSEENNGVPTYTTFARNTQIQSAAPSPLFGLANSGLSAGAYADGRLTVTSPVHGQLEVFTYVSQVTNVCHISTVWTPAS